MGVIMSKIAILFILVFSVTTILQSMEQSQKDQTKGVIAKLLSNEDPLYIQPPIPVKPENDKNFCIMCWEIHSSEENS